MPRIGKESTRRYVYVAGIDRCEYDLPRLLKVISGVVIPLPAEPSVPPPFAAEPKPRRVFCLPTNQTYLPVYLPTPPSLCCPAKTPPGVSLTYRFTNLRAGLLAYQLACLPACLPTCLHHPLLLQSQNPVECFVYPQVLPPLLPSQNRPSIQTNLPASTLPTGILELSTLSHCYL